MISIITKFYACLKNIPAKFLKQGIKLGNSSDLKPVKVVESGEEMVNISDYLKNCICEYALPDMIPFLGDEIWVRKSVADKLGRISSRLGKKFPSYRLKIVYGYRHPVVQNSWFNKIKNELQLAYPLLNDDELIELANARVANPETAGHPTGGAVDLTITTESGDLDMGTDYADFSEPEKFIMFSKKISKVQMENRMILHDLMVSEEFAPYYGEWWHYSFGDKEWAWFYEKPNAIYDQIDLTTNLIVKNAIEFQSEVLLEHLLKVEKVAWKSSSDELTASTSKIQKRIEIFPKGVSIATLGNVPVGSQFAFRFNWDGNLEKLTSWDEITSDGNIENVHQTNGDTGFLVGVGVLPEFRGKKYMHNLQFEGEYKASELLIAYTLEMLFNAGVKQVIANARIPFYHMMPEAGNPMNVWDYCSLREPDGRLFDPVLRFHERMGAKVIKPVVYSMPDPESLNGGAWVLYTHKFNS